ncbi:proline-rich receptor-like protein kinase PERK9 [Capsicum galapagoense]
MAEIKSTIYHPFKQNSTQTLIHFSPKQPLSSPSSSLYQRQPWLPQVTPPSTPSANSIDGANVKPPPTSSVLPFSAASRRCSIRQPSPPAKPPQNNDPPTPAAPPAGEVSVHQPAPPSRLLQPPLPLQQPRKLWNLITAGYINTK